jgi:signal transduction histidine kinase
MRRIVPLNGSDVESEGATCQDGRGEGMTSRTNRAVRLIVIPVATGIAVGALAIEQGPGRFTTYAGRSALAAALMLAAGLSLLASGVLAMGGRAHRRTGGLAVLAGLTWFAPVWVAWQDGPSLVPSIAMVLSGLTLAFVFHLTLAARGGTARPGPVRALISVVYVEAALLALGLALFRDPYFDPGCWANCIQNAFLVHSLPWLTRAIEEADRWFVSLAGITLIVVCLVRLATGSRPARAALAPIAVPGIMFAGAAVARVLALQRTTREDPFNGRLFASFVVESSAVILVAAGLVAVIFRARLQRRAVARIVTELDEAPAAGSLRSALALALGDPELRIAYRLTERDRYVDSNGRPVDEPVAGNGRANTRFVRDERMIAVLSHSASLPDLEGAIGPALLLALENERLQAELLAELEELRASRARIVETADAERRRLERDLHDGAQQRLLALSYDIRIARAAARSGGDARAGSLLTQAIGLTQQALDDLRTLAHGIYPVVLAAAGLGPALRTLAEGAPIPVDVAGADDRYPDPIETAAYLAVSEGVDDALGRSAHRAVVAVAHEDGRLVVTVEDDGSDRAAPMLAIIDRVGALGGEVIVGPKAFRVEIPCG